MGGDGRESVGIILCTGRNETVAKVSLLELQRASRRNPRVATDVERV